MFLFGKVWRELVEESESTISAGKGITDDTRLISLKFTRTIIPSEMAPNQRRHQSRSVYECFKARSWRNSLYIRWSSCVLGRAQMFITSIKPGTRAEQRATLSCYGEGSWSQFRSRTEAMSVWSYRFSSGLCGFPPMVQKHTCIDPELALN